MIRKKFGRFISRVLAFVLALGMVATYTPNLAYAMDSDGEAPSSVEVSVVEENSQPASEPAAQETSNQEESQPSEEAQPAVNEEVIPPVIEGEEDPSGEEELTDEEILGEETEEVVLEEEGEDVVLEEEEEIAVMARPMMRMMLAPPPGPDPKGDPEDAKEYYPDNTNMQDLYVKYGDEFKTASDKMVDEPSNDNLVDVVNTMNDTPVSNPTNVSALDENRKSIGEVIMVDGADNDGDGYPDPEFYRYEKDPVTNEVKLTRLEEKTVEGLTDEMVEEKTKIDEIIAKYGKENTDVKEYYDEVPKEIKQPKNAGHHVNLFPTNQNGVKFEEPITTTDSTGKTVYLWNYKIDFAGETATVEQGNLRWDTSKKRDYGDKGYGCWIFVDKNNKEWNLTNSSTTSTGSHQIKAIPYSDEYMDSIEKDLYKWFVENGDKNGQGNTYQYGDIEKIFKYAIVNAEGWNYFNELDSKLLAKSKPKDNPPDIPPGPGPGPEPGPDPDPDPDPDPKPGPGPNPDPYNPPAGGNSNQSSNDSTFTVVPVNRTVYLVVVDDNIVYTPEQVALVKDFLNGITLVDKNAVFRFIYSDDVVEETFIDIDRVITVGALRSESGLSEAISKGIAARGNAMNFINFWLYDDPAVIDDGMENKSVDVLEAKVARCAMYVRSNAIPGEAITQALNAAGMEFGGIGSVTYETLVAVLTS